MLDAVLDLHQEAVGQAGVRGAGPDAGRTAGQVLQLRHLVVERDRGRVRIVFVEGQSHRDAHKEILGRLRGLLLRVLDRVAVEQTGQARVGQAFVALDVERLGQLGEVELLRHLLVEDAHLHLVLDVLRELLAMLLGQQLLVVAVLADDAPVDGLHQEPGRDRVVLRILGHVLQRGVDRRLVHLVAGNAVVDGQAGLGGDLDHLAERVGQTLGGALDRAVDLVGVELFDGTVTLDDR